MNCGHCQNPIEGRIYFSGDTPAHWKCKNILNAKVPKVDVTEEQHGFKVGDEVMWCKSIGCGGLPIEGVVSALSGKFIEIVVAKKSNRPETHYRVLASSLVKRKDHTGPLGSTFGHLWNNY